MDYETPGDGRELRVAFAPIRGVEVRDATGTHDGSWTMSGYAAVFDTSTTLYNGNGMVVRESIAPGAFDNVLRSAPTVHLNLNHDMQTAVASTTVPAGEIGSLTLRADDHGLYFMARVDRNDPDAQRMAIKMQRGVIDQASFAFAIEDERKSTAELDDGTIEYTYRISDIRALYDVCATPQGAYPTTSANVRSLLAAVGQPEREATSINPGLPEGANAITPLVGGVESAERRTHLAKLRANARVRMRLIDKKVA